MRPARRINIAVDRRWNPLRAGYAGATIFYITAFFLFGETELPWWIALLAMAVGFVIGLQVGRRFTTWFESRKVSSAGGRHRGNG